MKSAIKARSSDENARKLLSLKCVLWGYQRLQISSHKRNSFFSVHNLSV